MTVETAPPRVTRGVAFRRAAADPALLGALILALVFCLYGIHWGATEPWEPDQMAYHDALTDDGRLNLHPGDFLKPPFHMYFSFTLARVPAYAVSELLGFSEITLRKITLVWARMLTVALFLVQIVLVYAITQRFFGLFAARIVTLAYATSAGLIAFSHFLTADIPVTTWMLAAFYFAQNVLLRGRFTDYLLAGTFTGMAAATKYNGLAIGITFVIAHALASEWRSWMSVAFDLRLILAFGAVPAAFFICNPFSVLDAHMFVNDFMYNLVTTPVYLGDTRGNNYLGYWSCVIEVIGLPAFILLIPAVIGGAWFTFRGGVDSVESHGLVMLLSISLLYYAYFGSFPRLETRFVLPVVPYLMMLAGPACERLRSSVPVVVPVLGLLLLYNAGCSAVVGSRFVNDPRMTARSWLRSNLPARGIVEYSTYAPRPDLIEGAGFARMRMPMISGRIRIFSDILADNVWVRENINRFEKSGEDWYSAASLRQRGPEAVAVDSLYYCRFLEGPAGEAYYEIKEFFTNLLKERLGYGIIFDRTSQEAPFWAYPREIDSLHNRIVILERSRTNATPTAPAASGTSLSNSPATGTGSGVYGLMNSIGAALDRVGGAPSRVGSGVEAACPAPVQ
jgi:hypothetical protein